MNPKVQVSKDFLDGVKTLLDALECVQKDELTQLLCNALQDELNAKYEALERRRAYTEYRRSTTGTPERENKRQEYLNQSGIHKDWRTPQETSSSPE